MPDIFPKQTLGQSLAKLTESIDDLHRGILVEHVAVGRVNGVVEIRVIDIGGHQAELVLVDVVHVVLAQQRAILVQLVGVVVVDLRQEGEHFGAGPEALHHKLFVDVNILHGSIFECDIDRWLWPHLLRVGVLLALAVVVDLTPGTADVDAGLQLADAAAHMRRHIHTVHQILVDVVEGAHIMAGYQHALVAVAAVRVRRISRQVDRVEETALRVYAIAFMIVPPLGHRVHPEGAARHQPEQHQEYHANHRDATVKRSGSVILLHFFLGSAGEKKTYSIKKLPKTTFRMILKMQKIKSKSCLNKALE